MGAVVEIVKQDEKTPKVLSYEANEKIFSEDHEKFKKRMIDNEVINILNSAENGNNLNQYFQKFESKAQHNNIQNVKALFYQLIGESYIKKQLQNNVEVFKYIKSIYNNIDFSDEELKKCKKAEERFQKEFEISMYHVLFNQENKDIKNLNNLQIKGIFDNFKFYPEFQPQILTIIINHSLLGNKNSVILLSSVLQYCPKLQVVNLIIYPLDKGENLVESFGFDGLYYQMLYNIFYGIANNRNIKSLCIHSVKDYSLVFAPEITNLIIQKLQSETLVSFHIGNIILNGDFLKKFGFQILSTRSLLFLSIEMKEIKKSVTENLISNLPKNRSLIACSFVSPHIKNIKKNVESLKAELEKVKSQIEVLYIGKKSIIEYPPKSKK